MLTYVIPAIFGFAVLTAMTCTGFWPGSAAGALYWPAGLIVPAVALPPLAPPAYHVTSLPESPDTCAENCTVLPIATDGIVGDTVMLCPDALPSEASNETSSNSTKLVILFMGMILSKPYRFARAGNAHWLSGPTGWPFAALLGCKVDQPLRLVKNRRRAAAKRRRTVLMFCLPVPMVLVRFLTLDRISGTERPPPNEALNYELRSAITSGYRAKQTNKG